MRRPFTIPNLVHRPVGILSVTTEAHVPQTSLDLRVGGQHVNILAAFGIPDPAFLEHDGDG